MSFPRYRFTIIPVIGLAPVEESTGAWCKWSDVAPLLERVKELELCEEISTQICCENCERSHPHGCLLPLRAERDQLRSQVSALTAASFDWKHQLEHDFKANPHWLKKKIVEAAKLYLDTYQTPVHPAAKQEVDFMVALNELLK